MEQLFQVSNIEFSYVVNNRLLPSIILFKSSLNLQNKIRFEDNVSDKDAGYEPIRSESSWSGNS